MIRNIDLHMHSCFSDGDKTPKQLIEYAVKKNIDVISLTDHDCIDGLSQMHEEAKKAGITFISGIELSCFDKKDTHILGYSIHWHDSEFKEALNALQKARTTRMEKMVEALAMDGFDINIDEVQLKCNGKVMGRPHIAAVLLEKGYGKTIRDIFNKYIGNGCRYYVHYKKLEVQEGIDLIHKVGGYAVLAHPKLLRYNTMDFTELIKRYKKMGLDGIETYYPCHYDEHIKFFSKMAAKLDLLNTCGGDYHNDYDNTKNIMGFDASLPGISRTIEVLTGGSR